LAAVQTYPWNVGRWWQAHSSLMPHDHKKQQS
jgi:hypothetical protein